MMMFDITKDNTKLLVTKFIKFHGLKDEKHELLIKHIDNYSREVQLVYNNQLNNQGLSEKKEEEEDMDVIIIKQNN